MGEQGMRRLTHRGAKKVETSQPISGSKDRPIVR